MAATINDILPQQLQQLLLSLEREDIRYENQFTGPHLAFLNGYFPFRDSFMVTHIPRIRTAVLTKPSGPMYPPSSH